MFFALFEMSAYDAKLMTVSIIQFSVYKIPIYIPLPKNLYKNYTKFTQKLYKTLNLYITCIQRLYKSRFFIVMNIQKNVHQIPIYIYIYIYYIYIYYICIYIYIYILYIYIHIYKTCTKFRLKTVLNLKCIFFNVQTMCKLYKTYTTS